MTTNHNYDAIIIGAGQAGGPLSTALVHAGWKTALIERQFVGGTCINWGCTPTKTMVASGRVAYLARRAADYGVRTGPVMVDMARVRQRKREIVADFRGGSQQRIERSGVELIFGQASFTGAKTIAVQLNDGGVRHLTGDKIFINSGGRPEIPALEGLDQVPFLDSTSIMELDSLPEHLIMLGGGYIGLEFGQMFRRFGSRVTVVQRGSQLLGREDPDVAEEMAKILSQDGLEIMLEAEARRVRRTAEGRIELAVQTPAGERLVYGSHLLVSAGRLPNTEALNLAAAGIETNRGFIKVNDRLETNVPGVYALGDVKGGPAFTHISYDDFRRIKANLLEGAKTTISGRPVPYTLFTDPQLARIGLNECEAKAQGLNYRVAKMPMSYVARALEMDEPRGFMKAIVEAESRQILGFTVIGIEGGEIMAMVQLAMLGQLPYPLLREAIFAHPTLAEGLNNLFATLDR
jgi:pyruvate/2-oxoglutarate dehydrogenase complex dihydrolipoamide dehydrogenase (E3) component